jgi:hypothetical protein
MLEAYWEASFANDSAPLVIAGLLSENLRVRGHALRVAGAKLGIRLEPVDFEADDAEERAKRQAGVALDALREDERVATYLNTVLDEAVPDGRE